MVLRTGILGYEGDSRMYPKPIRSTNRYLQRSTPSGFELEGKKHLAINRLRPQRHPALLLKYSRRKITTFPRNTPTVLNLHPQPKTRR